MFLDRCKVAQFPNDTSLPAMLVENALMGFPGPMDAIPAKTQTVIHVLDVYNDAAHFALDRCSWMLS